MDNSQALSVQLQETMSLAQVFLESGLFKDTKTKAEAVVKILAGREFGLSPLQSMTDIYMVNGKVALQSKVISALIKKSGKYDFHVEKLDNTECVLSFWQLNGEARKIGESSFTMKDAAAAGLANKAVWQAYPRNLLFARAVSNGGRLFCADVITAYTPEEVEDGLLVEVPKAAVVSIDATGEVKSDASPM